MVSLGSNPNYVVTATNSALTISGRAASVVAEAKSKIYGEENPALTAVTNGAVNGDVINVTLSTDATTSSGVGVSNIVVTPGSNPNYLVAATNSTLTISGREASVVADAKSKIYGEENPALTAVTNGAVNGDVINATLTTDATQYSGVGVSNIVVNLGSNPNYVVTATNSALTISGRVATVVAEAKSKVYGEENPALTAVLVGEVVGGDALNYTLSTDATQYSGVGISNIVVNLGSNPNYLVAATNSTLTISGRAATVVADAKSKIYGEENPALTAVIVGEVVGGDTLNYTLSTDATQYSAVGVSNITVTPGSNPNYVVTSTNSTLTINGRPASVVAEAKSKIYGEENPSLTAVTNGAVNGEVINATLTTDATQYSGVGVSNIVVNLGSNPNYVVTATNSTLTISGRAATVVAEAKSKI